jgi:putative PIN family toxin of toxin-antitoxin system
VRVVFDTNVLISAFGLPGGVADAAIRRIVSGSDRLIISKAIIDEFLGVLARKFSRDPEALARIALFLTDLAEVVRSRRRLRVLHDDADNRILECAIAGRAELIVTGDRAMLRLGHIEQVSIVTLRRYLDLR